MYFPLFTAFVKKFEKNDNFGDFFLEVFHILTKFVCFPAFFSCFYHFFSTFSTIFLWFSNFFYPGWLNDHDFGCISHFLLVLEKIDGIFKILDFFFLRFIDVFVDFLPFSTVKVFKFCVFPKHDRDDVLYCIFLKNVSVYLCFGSLPKVHFSFFSFFSPLSLHYTSDII